MNHLRGILLSDEADVLFLQETFLFTDIPDSLFVGGTGFSMFRRDRSQRRGGGVALLVRSGFQCSPLAVPHGLEIVALDLVTSICTYRLVNLYRPPNSSHEYLKSLTNFLLSLEDPSRILVIAGDLNLPSLYGPQGPLVTRNGLSTRFNDSGPTHD